MSVSVFASNYYNNGGWGGVYVQSNIHNSKNVYKFLLFIIGIVSFFSKCFCNPDCYLLLACNIPSHPSSSSFLEPSKAQRSYYMLHLTNLCSSLLYENVCCTIMYCPLCYSILYPTTSTSIPPISSSCYFVPSIRTFACNPFCNPLST